MARAGLLLGLAICTATRLQVSLEIASPCKSDQHYDYAGRCCVKCEPGKYMSARCTATSETVCRPCGPNEYMDIWNEEEKCLLHKICDHGKALIEVHPGNSTSQRQCACTAGYHWNEDCDCCRRNTKCPLGYGVKYPIQQNKDTMCIQCPRGYFSNVSSAIEACKTWINCTALRMEEKSPGNDWSDAVCKKRVEMHTQAEINTLFYLLIAPLLIVALVGIVVLVIYYHNKGKTMTDIQYWTQVICRQLKGTKDSHADTFVNGNLAHPTGQLFLEGAYLLDLDEYSFSEDVYCPYGHVTQKDGPNTIQHGSEEDFRALSLVSEDDHFRQMPTENEYTDKMAHGPHYLHLLSHPESTPVSPFSEPMEVGENDSLSQCFTGTESLVELSNCCYTDNPCGMDPVHVSSGKCLQNSCHPSTCSNARDCEHKDIGVSSLVTGGANNCMACGESCGESPSKPGSISNAFEGNGHPPSSTCGIDSSFVDQTSSANSARNDPCDGNGPKHHSTKRTPESNDSASDSAAASGNVTGNGNSTFISSGQVMNFKGEVIVVYVSQNSQEGSMSPGSSDDSLGSPVQEENQNRCDTFAGNAYPYKEKCSDMSSLHSVIHDKPPPTGEGSKRTCGPIIQDENHEDGDSKHLYNEASQPVQEEGKPGQVLTQTLH